MWLDEYDVEYDADVYYNSINETNGKISEGSFFENMVNRGTKILKVKRLK